MFSIMSDRGWRGLLGPRPHACGHGVIISNLQIWAAATDALHKLKIGSFCRTDGVKCLILKTLCFFVSVGSSRLNVERHGNRCRSKPTPCQPLTLEVRGHWRDKCFTRTLILVRKSISATTPSVIHNHTASAQSLQYRSMWVTVC